MKPRAFAAAWTAFTVLAAPAVLGAQEAPAPPAAEAPAVEQPAAPPTVPVAPAPAAPVAPAPAPSAPAPAAPAAPGPAPEPAAPAPEPAVDTQPAKRKRSKPVARAAADTSVTIKDFSFSPSSVSISVGDTVTWTNQGPSVHTATGDGFDTGNLSKGQSGSHTFNEAGTFSYVCSPHPFMKGTVNVAAASGGGSEDDSTAGSDDSFSGSATLEGSTTSDSGLADTGSEAWLLALIGAVFLWLGLALQRRLGVQR